MRMLRLLNVFIAANHFKKEVYLYSADVDEIATYYIYVFIYFQYIVLNNVLKVISMLFEHK